MERRHIWFWLDALAQFKGLVVAGMPTQQADSYLGLLVRLIELKSASDMHLRGTVTNGTMRISVRHPRRRDGA